MNFSAQAATLALLLSGSALSQENDQRTDYCVRHSRSLRSDINRGAIVFALDIAERCAALPDLADSQRAAALLDLADMRVLVGDYIGAERDLKRALELEPGDADAPFSLAQVLRDRPQEALRYAEQAAQAAVTVRRRAAAHRLVGEIRFDLGDAAGAQSSIGRALELSGQDLDALWDMVRILRGRPQEASAYALRASRAAETAPLWYRPAAYRLCARTWLELEDYSQATASLRRALALNPDDRDALRAMIRIKHVRPRETALEGERRTGDERPKASAETEAALTRALTSDPDDLEALRKLIALKRGQKKFSEAAALADQFVEAVERYPEWQRTSAYRLAAEIWIGLGNMPKASQSILQAQGLDWRSLESALLAARIATGDQKRAASQILADAYLACAEEHKQLGDFARAEKNRQRALKILPDSELARRPTALDQ